MKGNNIKNARLKANLTQEQLAAAIGTTKQNIYKYENSIVTNIPLDKIEAMASVLDVTPCSLVGWQETVDSFYNNLDVLYPEWKSVPLLGNIACGEPILAEENIEGYVNVTSDVHCDFVLRCKGDSMAPRLLEGDLVMIRIQPDVVDGQIAAVLIENEATLKHVYHLPNRSGIQLTADNPSYSPMVFLGEDAANIRILGLAVAYRRMLV